MSRLLVFGCSFTYGQGLPDCYNDTIKVYGDRGDYPSKYSWGYLLGKKLNLEVVNYAKPGIGNLEILIKILQTEFKPDDLVITCFSFFERYFFYQFTEYDDGYGLRFNNGDQEYYDLVKYDATDKYVEQKYYWHNWLAIHHAELYLKSKNITNYSLTIGLDKHMYNLKNTSNNVQLLHQSKIPSLLQLQNFLNIDFKKIDFALDNAHPGLESHMLFASKIYTKIRDNELHRRNPR